MANITLGQLRDLWQAVADWANGLKEPKVQLSGSIPAGSNLIGRVQIDGRSVQNVRPRAVRVAGMDFVVVSVPTGVRGFIYEVRVYGVTGTFEAGQGVRAAVYARSITGAAISVYGVQTTRSTSAGAQHHIVVYPGASAEGLAGISGSQIAAASLPPATYYRCDIDITGSFSAGEGVDCEAVILWLI